MNTFKPSRTLPNIFSLFLVTAVDKKMAEKASQEWYVSMAMVFSKQKKKEKQETENILKKMEQKYEEIEQKVEELRVEQKEDRKMIEQLGDLYVRM